MGNDNWHWGEPNKHGSVLSLFAPDRYRIGESGEVARVAAKANGDTIECTVIYLDEDGNWADGEPAATATAAKRSAATLALEARIEWYHRQMLAARVALDAGKIEETLALLAGAERQRELGVADA